MVVAAVSVVVLQAVVVVLCSNSYCYFAACEIELDHFLDLGRTEEDSFECCQWFRPEVPDLPDPDCIDEDGTGDREVTRGESGTVEQDNGYLSEDHLVRKLHDSVSLARPNSK